MFPRRYFAGRYFAPTFFPQSQGEAVEVGGLVCATVSTYPRVSATVATYPRVNASVALGEC